VRTRTSRRLLRVAAAIATLASVSIIAPAAYADNVGISLSGGSPEEGIPVTVTLAGTAAAIDDAGDGAYLYAVARPAGGVGCQESFGADQVAAGNASTVLIDGDQQDPDQPFSEEAELTPGIGGSIVCAWVETDANDGSDIATPDEVTTGPVSLSFDSTGPQVGPLQVSAPAKIKVNQGYQITYATQTDQDVNLDSVVIPAGGDGCASSYEAEAASSDPYNDVFGGSSDVFGSETTAGDDSETTAGQYVICSWIEGPDQEQVDAATATDITIGSPPTNPVFAGTSSSPSSGSGSAAGSTSAPACVVPKYSGATLATERKRLKAAHCSVGVIHRVRGTVRSGVVVKLSASPGRRLKPGAAVQITVSKA
jgi:hypothetical protein